MPKRYTDAEITKIVDETAELRDYVKQLLINNKLDEETLKNIHNRLAMLSEDAVTAKKVQVDSMAELTEKMTKMETRLNEEIRRVDLKTNNTIDHTHSKVHTDFEYYSWMITELFRRAPTTFLAEIDYHIEKGTRRARSEGYRPERYIQGSRSYDRDEELRRQEYNERLKIFAEPEPKLRIESNLTSLKSSLENLKQDETKISGPSFSDIYNEIIFEKDKKKGK